MSDVLKQISLIKARQESALKEAFLRYLIEEKVRVTSGGDLKNAEGKLLNQNILVRKIVTKIKAEPPTYFQKQKRPEVKYRFNWPSQALHVYFDALLTSTKEYFEGYFSDVSDFQDF